MYKMILSPVDGSPTSRRGMQEAIGLAKDQGARLRFLHVVDLHVLAMDSFGAVNYGDLLDSFRASGTKILEEAKSAALREGVEADSAMIESIDSRVGDAIVGHAGECGADIIVMGTHGRRGASHLLMGSDAEIVVRTSNVPVLLVRFAVKQ